MEKYGIRISDRINNIISIPLYEILEGISNGSLFYWSILYLEAMGNLGEGKSIPVFENEIIHAQNGYFISWDELTKLARKFVQVKDILIIGCLNKDIIKRYENDQEMHETCDIVIEMVDCGHWEVFSKDHDLIRRLAEKFNETKFLEYDFEK